MSEQNPDQPANHSDKRSAGQSTGTLSDPAALEKYFRSAQFEQSAAKLAQCPVASLPELAFAGRSNAGKSSAINKLAGNRKLARTSKTPGRTQLINFFQLNDEHRLVDLPGYGYAKVSRSTKLQWQQHLLDYLAERETLAGLVLVMDVRHPLQAFDTMMLDWCRQYGMSCIILLTKCDKLSRNDAKKAFFKVQTAIDDKLAASPILFSAHSEEGLGEARQQIYQLLHATQGAS